MPCASLCIQYCYVHSPRRGAAIEYKVTVIKSGAFIRFIVHKSETDGGTSKNEIITMGLAAIKTAGSVVNVINFTR